MGKSKSYNRILDYLENEAVDFADAIKNCCIEYLLSPSKKRGITLLLPTSDILRSRIYSLSEGSPEDKQLAVRMISALVIPLNLKNTEDFTTNKDILQNSLHQVIEVRNIDEMCVEFMGDDNSLIAKKDLQFRDASRDGILNVYELTSDAGMPLDSPPAPKIETRIRAQTVASKPRIKKRDISNAIIFTDYDSRRAHQLRSQISMQVENMYARDMVSVMNGKSPLHPYNENVFIESAYSLLWYVMNKEEYYNDVFLGKMLPYVSHREIDFYFFLEPHCIKQSENDYLVPTKIIAEWWREKTIANTKEIYKAIDVHLTRQQPVAMQNTCPLYKDRNAIMATIDESRYQIETAATMPSGVCTNITASTIISEYTKIANIWPPPIAELYKRNKYRKLLEDELRYIAFKQFSKLNNKFDLGDYEEWLAVIANYMHQEPSEKKLRLLKIDKTDQSIDPKDMIREMCTFVQSTYYMFIPMTFEETASFNGKFNGTNERPDVDVSEAIWNIHYDAHVNRRKPSAVSNEHVGGMLKMLYENQKNEMSPEAVKAIEAYLGISN